MNANRPMASWAGALLSAGGLLVSWHAQAQTEQDTLQEVVVTATRRADVASRVPMTISAVTQETLDQQGIKTAADLTRIVPSLNTVANPGGGQQTLSIRGIVGATGAATTSVYLDDVNLTKRANGGVAQNNGVVTPILYDLARVEVLKGPQGTLYGGSSEGGTVRFITPTPSLSEFSGAGRAEFSTVGSRGTPSYEAGGAVGGPIIQDRLGFRLSAIKQESGGWIDDYSAYTGKLIRPDANTATDWAARAALLWQINDHANAQLSGYHVENKFEGGPTTTTAIYVNGQPAHGATFTTSPRCITNNTRTAPLAQPGAAPATAFIPANVACNAPTPTTVFFRPSYSYGPFTTGQDIALATGIQRIFPATSEANIASLTLNYDLDVMNVKLISSYLNDTGHSDTPGGEEWDSTTNGQDNSRPSIPRTVVFRCSSPSSMQPERATAACLMPSISATGWKKRSVSPRAARDLSAGSREPTSPTRSPTSTTCFSATSPRTIWSCRSCTAPPWPDRLAIAAPAPHATGW